MKETTPGLRLGAVALALVTCHCAALQPLVVVPRDTQDRSYEAAQTTAAALIDEYRERIDAVSKWLVTQRFAEALAGGGAVSAIVEGTTEGDSNRAAVSGVLALVGVIVQIVVDEGDMRRQKEAYTRGVAALQCAVAAVAAEGVKRNTLPELVDAARADLLFSTVSAIEGGVLSRIESETQAATSVANSRAALDGVNGCLSRLAANVPMLR